MASRRGRDFQRSKVYAAEEFLVFCRDTLELDELRDWVNSVVGSKWFQNKWLMEGTIIITDGRGRRRACGSARFTSYRDNVEYTQPSPKGGLMKMPRFARTKGMALHELTHIIVGWYFPYRAPFHGREFCSVYLKLVRRWIGKKEASELRDSFRGHGVKFVVR